MLFHVLLTTYEIAAKESEELRTLRWQALVSCPSWLAGLPSS